MFIRVTEHNEQRDILIPVNKISVCKEATSGDGNTNIIMENATAYSVSDTLSEIEGKINQALDYAY